MPAPLPFATLRYSIVRCVLPFRIAALLCVLLALPATVFAQSDDEPTRLIPIPSPTKGLSFNLDWDADLFDNLDGGVRRGYATDSLLSAGLGLDTGKLVWWQGGRFAFGAQAITSTHPSENYVGDLQTLSNIDAPNDNQVSEFWYSQAIGDNLLVRGGIMFMEDFFDTNDTASLFINSSYGVTPTLPSNVPAPVYPASAWGVMARIGAEHNDWRFGIFQGDPEHRSTALKRGAMLIAEHDWLAAGSETRLGIGAWYRHAPASVAPTSDWGAYANLEQPLGHSNTSLFAQLGASPGDINDVPGYLAGGVVFHDVSSAVSEVGFGFARAWIRDHAAETSLEATAAIPLFKGALVLQPDVQYILHPSGIHPNALVIGLRLHAAFY